MSGRHSTRDLPGNYGWLAVLVVAALLVGSSVVAVAHNMVAGS